MKLISGWQSHCTGLNRPRRVVMKKHVTIHRSSLIWWPGSTVKRSRDTTEAKGTNPGPTESGTTSDGTAQPQSAEHPNRAPHHLTHPLTYGQESTKRADRQCVRLNPE